MTRVLVVDNEPAARKTIVDILSLAHYEVTEASDGGTVVEKANSQRPDLILMDVDLPVMNGLDVLGRLREHPACRDTPVIMMASENNPARRRLHAWRLGVKHYIIKPTQFDLVALAVKVTLPGGRLQLRWHRGRRRIHGGGWLACQLTAFSRHRGCIGVDGEPGFGSTFTVYMPGDSDLQPEKVAPLCPSDRTPRCRPARP